MQEEEGEGIDEKISFLVHRRGRKEILKENILKYEVFYGTRFVDTSLAKLFLKKLWRLTVGFHVTYPCIKFELTEKVLW